MNTPIHKLLSALGTLGALAVSPAYATPLTYEGFDYTSAANVTGLTGGSGWHNPASFSWATGGTTGMVATSGLSYTGIDAAYTTFAPTGLAANYGGAFQNQRLLDIDAAGVYDTAGLRGAGNFIGGSTVTGTLWGSFLVSASVWDTGSGPQMLFNLGSTAGTGTQASIRQTGAGSAISLTNGGGGGIGAIGSIDTSELSTTVPNLIVFRYQFNGPSDDTLEVWLNPTSTSDTASISATQPNFVFNLLILRSVNANGNLVFDEVRFGTTFADVVPVPGAAEPDPTPAPAAPTALQSTVNSFSEITLDWTDNSSNELSFVVERSLDGTTGWTPVGALGSDIATFQDIGLTASTLYYYRVFATNSGGNSTYSAVVSATTSALPALVALNTIYQPFADPDGENAELAAAVPGILAYAGPGLIQASSALLYPGVPSSGNGFTADSGSFFMTLDTTLPGLERYMSGGRIGGSGLGFLYVSWMARGINGNESNTVDFRSGNEANQSIVSVGTTFGDQPNIRLITGNTLTSGPQNYITTTHAASPATDFFVVKFTFRPGNTSTVDLFINQTSEGTPNASSTCFAQFNTIGINKIGVAPNPSFDEFRMGTSFQAVTGNTGSSGLVAFRANNSLAANGAGDLLTPANDGVSNLLKYAFNMIGGGTGQTASLNTSNVAIVAADGSAGLPRQGLNAGALTLTYIRRAAASNSGVTYVVKFSSNLMTFAANPAATEIVVDLGGGLERVTVTDSVVAPGKRFARVEVIAN